MVIVHELHCRRGCGHTVKATDRATAEAVRDDHERVCQQIRPHLTGVPT